jgi:parallel beta-helix repeat protein
LREEKNIMDRNPALLYKSLAVGIILLYIGGGIQPVIAYENPKNPPSIGNILYVGGSGPGNYTRIQDAIDNARYRDIVFVYDDSSPYYENVVIHRSIKLIGEDKNTTIIDGMEYETVVSVQANKVFISGFTITNSGDEYHKVGILIGEFSNNNIITSNIITNNWKGIEIVKSIRNTIKYNKISNNSFGVICHNCYLQTIKSNTIINNVYGIKTFHSFSTIVTGNNILSNKEYGIYISKWGGIFIIKNNFIENEVDAYFWQNIFRNRWRQNYWNEPLTIPKIIYGKLILVGHSIPLELTVINIDWNPAKVPYDI